MPRILVIKPSSLGDIIHGLLVAESIRQQMPGAVIDWVARDIFAPLVDACETVDRVHVFHRGAGLGAFGQLLQDLRETPYEWALDLQGLARSGAMAQFSGVPRCHRVGRHDAREGSRWACGRWVKLPPGGREAHAVDILREFLPVLGLKNELRGTLRFAPPPGTLLPPSGGVLLFPGSRRAEKEWPGFADLTARLVADEHLPPVVWAGDRETAAPEQWPPARFGNLTGRTALAALPALVASARLVVANDSGPMHLAAAMGRPVIGLFGPTAPERFGPYPLDAPTSRVLVAPGGCLADLSAETVLTEIVSGLQSG